MFQVIAAGHEVPQHQAEAFGSFVKRTFALVALVLAAALAMAVIAPVASAAEASQQTADTVQPSIGRITITWNTFVFDDLTDSWTQVSFESQCSGFVIDPDGYIVTAGHCLDPELASDSAIEFRAKQLYNQNTDFFEEKGISLKQLVAYGLQNWTVEGKDEGSEITPKVEVALPGGDNSDEPVTYSGEVLDVDATNDVALLKIDATGLPALELADESDIEIGESVFAVGFPALRDSVTDPSYRPTFKSGTISDTQATRNEGDVPIYETSAPMGQGMSGGPTVNAEGQVVGVNSYGTTLNNDFNWIAPSHLVSDMLSENGVTPELGQTDVLYRQALDAFYSGDYRSAVTKLQAVLNETPDHPVALGLIEEAKEGAKTQPAPETHGLNLPLLPIGLAAAVIATLAVSFLMGRTFARKVGHPTAAPAGMAMAIPAPPAINLPAAAPSTPTTPIGFQPPARTEATEAKAHNASSFCPNCGVAAPQGSHFCQRCGTNVG